MVCYRKILLPFNFDVLAKLFITKHSKMTIVQSGCNVQYLVSLSLSTEVATGDFLKNAEKFTGNHLCWSFSLIKLQAWGLQINKKRPQYRCFLVDFAKLFKTHFLQGTSGQLLLYLCFFLQLRDFKGILMSIKRFESKF